MIYKVADIPHVSVPKAIGTKRDPKKDYMWYEMGIFTYWDFDCRRVLCIDTPVDLPEQIKAILEKQASPLEFGDPFAMFPPLIDQIVKLSDDSVWRFRPHIRYIEKVCFNLLCFLEEWLTNTEQNRLTTRPDFTNMHNLSRHAIHVSEVLSVTIDTIENILREQKAIHESLETDLGKSYCRQAQDYTRFQLQMVK